MVNTEKRSMTAKPYAIVSKNRKPPNYDRVVASCSDDELRADLANDRGDDGFRQAALAELNRRMEKRRRDGG